MDGEAPDEDEVKKRIGALFDFAVSDAGCEFRSEICRSVSTMEAERIAALTDERVDSYQNILDSHAIRHVIKNHGDAREHLRGQVPIGRSDFLLLLEITARPDVIAYAEKTKPGRNTVLYTKTVNDELVFAMVEIRTGRKQLALITLHKRKRPA